MTEPTGSAVTTGAAESEVPIYGLPGYRFVLIHVTALVSLAVSIVVSFGVLVTLLRPLGTFFSRSIGDRLVVYLASSDLLMSVSHMMDHAYLYAVKDNPPYNICVMFAFFLNQFTICQSLIVIFTAFNAFYLVVLKKMLPTGRFDWKLLAVSLGIPAFLGTLGISTGHFGPTGTWCYIDIRRPLAKILANIVAVIMIITFLFNVICYLGIWIKVRQIARTQARGQKYGRTARIMMLFVAAYIGQWWAYVAFATWGLFGEPHVSIMWGAVFFSNMGGVFNFFAYTFIRKKYQKVAAETQATTNSSQQDRH